MNKEKTIERLKELKTEHELPNDNEGLYDIGYVKAMNNAINLVQNLNIGSVSGMALEQDEIYRRRKERNDKATAHMMRSMIIIGKG